MRRLALVASVAAPAALLLAGAAGAQSYGSSSYPQPGYSGGPSGYRAPADRPERPEQAERPEAPEGADPAQDLVRQLNLRGDQQAAYRDYQAAFQSQTQERDEGQDDVARLAAMTTPQRLDDSARQMDRDRADFERVAAATRRFYATLDPGQKRSFDRLTAPQAEPDEQGDVDDDPRAPSRPRSSDR